MTNILGELTLIRGIPGSGKSTMARQMIAANPRMVHLEADMYFINDEGQYVFKRSDLIFAHQWCQDTARVLLRNGIDVVVSNTFTTIREMNPYLMMKCRARHVITATGRFQNVHDCPAAVLEAMINRWEEYHG